MSLRRLQFAALSVALFTFLFASVAAQSTVRNAGAENARIENAAVAPAANWTFEGCWTQFAAGPCRDVYRDDQGNYWICRGCGTTGNPGPGKCNPISAGTLATGFWCS